MPTRGYLLFMILFIIHSMIVRDKNVSTRGSNRWRDTKRNNGGLFIFSHQVLIHDLFIPE